MNVHDFLLLISSVFEFLLQQVHLDRYHVYLLEFMHTFTSLVGLSMFFIPTLVGGHLLHKSGHNWKCDRKAPPTAAFIVSRVLVVNPW
jgi:hypothetical protein